MKVSFDRVCAIFLMLMVVAAHTLPTTTITTTTTTTERTHSRKYLKRRRLWWSNPCGLEDVFAHSTLPYLTSMDAHNFNVNETAMLVEIKNAQQQMNNVTATLAAPYPKFPLKRINYPWLPKEEKSIQGKQKVTTALTKFYKGLLKFSITIECLMEGDECSKFRQKHSLPYGIGIENGERMRNLQELKGQLRRMLCEVNRFLSTQLGVRRLPSSPSFKDINTQWFKEVNGTTQNTHDYVILKKYLEYLNKWVRTAKRLLVRVKQDMQKKQNKNSKIMEGRQQKKPQQ
ncbi:Hypothetical predicted protein [Cloeon dipterum]|uniref:Interleukin-6 n=1 Tax=Cloeon dipterum TaxID=197152 RepID=A0A8S1D590_9INSE|nr:Hypothetical predicted protein [Cloeon dipterum]